VRSAGYSAKKWGWYATRQIDERSKAVVYRIVDDWVASQT
jgi:hypothetical protein